MRVRLALLSLVLLMAPAGVLAQTPPAKVYGIEIEVRRGDQRLLVFADKPFEARLEEPDPETLVLVIPRAALDDVAPRSLRGPRGGAFHRVRVNEIRGGTAPELRIEMRRRPGVQPELEQRGSILALSFEGGAPTERIPMRFEGEELARVVDTVARATGETFIYDEKLRGRVTLAVPDPVSIDEARALLDTTLLLEGFAAVPTPSGAFRVLPLQEGNAAAPFQTEAPDAKSEALVTTFVRLEAADASFVANALRPWLGRHALAVPQRETNGLILAANEYRLHQLLSVLRILDSAATEDLLVRRLRHRTSDEIREILDQALGDGGPLGRAQLWTDARTNTVLARGTETQLEELRLWLAALDRPPPAEGFIHVRRARHVDPETLAQRLREVASGPPARLPAGAPKLQSGSFSVVADPPSSSLVIQAAPETYRAVEDLLDLIDVAPTRVHVEVLVVEIITDETLTLGFDALLPLSDPSGPDDWIATAFLDPTGSGLLQPGAGTGPAFAARVSRHPLVIPITDAMGSVVDLIIPRQTAVIQAEKAAVEARVLMRPHILAVSGEEHEIATGDNIPIRQAAVSEGAGGFLQNQINIVRQDVGVTLRVRPTVGQAGRVRLELDTQVTRVAASLAGDPDVVGPTIQQRSVNSTFWLSEDEVAVVGLGRFEEYGELETGTPWLKDIPLLGWFFKAVRTRLMRMHLLVTAQVRVQHSDAEMLAETIRRRLALERILSREGALQPQDGPYALRVTTRRLADDAEAIAQTLSQAGERTRVVRWEWEGDENWDVYVVGLETASEASDASLRAHDAGWHPTLVVVDARSS